MEHHKRFPHCWILKGKHHYLMYLRSSPHPSSIFKPWTYNDFWVFAYPCVHGRRKVSLGESFSLNGVLVWSPSRLLLQPSITSSRRARVRWGMVRPFVFGCPRYPGRRRGEYSSCCGATSYPLIPTFRLTPLVSVNHFILPFSRTQQLRHLTLKSPSLPVMSTTGTYRPLVLRKRTPCAKQQSPRYERFLNPPETFDLTRRVCFYSVHNAEIDLSGITRFLARLSEFERGPKRQHPCRGGPKS